MAAHRPSPRTQLSALRNAASRTANFIVTNDSESNSHDDRPCAKFLSIVDSSAATSHAAIGGIHYSSEKRIRPIQKAASLTRVMTMLLKSGLCQE
ncbi:MAG TPA: hypothetical protein VLS27_07880 [Gammaproteobacteria bacterium]|nr:hypothetical protein [Gammaproteobacteria bacterium]